MPADRDRPRIAFLTARDPLDRRSWSGIYYFMGKALEKHVGPVSYLGPLKVWQELAGKALNRASLSLLRKRYDYSHSTMLAVRYGRIFTSRVLRDSPDVIFAPAASTELARLETDVPAVYLSDITASLAVGYYNVYSDLFGVSVRNIFRLEKLAAGRSAALLYPTGWAARSAAETIPVDPRLVHVAPFGANLDHVPPASEVLGKKNTGRCRLLLLGVDWERKGGDIAHGTLLGLLEAGIDAELTVCGCIPPAAYSHERLKVIPFLDKNDAGHRLRFTELMSGSHFLILPTRAEAFGIVFCEAAAFGLPSITTDTGGIPDVVRNGENGYTLPLSAGAPEYAELIRRIYTDDDAYARLVKSSRAAYDATLNWDSWALTVKGVIEGVLR